MKEISVQELREVLEHGGQDNVLVIDVRTPAEHRSGRIPQVVNMPLDEIEKHADELRAYDAVYVHCKSGGRSGRACQKLGALGLENLTNVRGGIGEWERAGFEVSHDSSDSSGCRVPIMQQMLLTAGLLILSGFALAWLVHPYFLVMPLVVGAGLTFAGVTGKCSMVFALSKMPWNR
ncbi:MAG: rhodanese-like domain-containing protein [Patescibacteria group bacterium]